MDDVALVGSEFLKAREFVGYKKYQFQAAWEQLGAPQEVVTRMCHLDPASVYWTEDKHWLTHEKFTPEFLQLVRDLTGGPSFHNFGIKKQCALLGVPYIAKTPREMADEVPDLIEFASSRVEDFALHYYKYHGWQGEPHEGLSVNFFTNQVQQYCIARDVYTHGYSRSIVMRSSPNVPREIGERELSLVRQAVHYCYTNLEQTFKEASARSVSFITKKQAYIPLTLEQFITMCHVIGKELFYKMCAFYMNRFVFPSLPDLTIYKDGELAFIEVKQKNDRFTSRQPHWIKDAAQPMGLKVSVLHITDSIKTLLSR